MILLMFLVIVEGTADNFGFFIMSDTVILSGFFSFSIKNIVSEKDENVKDSMQSHFKYIEIETILD